MLTTSPSLLHQLREPNDALVWNKFVRLYAPLIYNWVRRTGLQAADADDLVQEVFRILVQKLPEFQYDRGLSFRNWLRAIVNNVWRNHCRQWARSTKVMDNLDECVGQEDAFSKAYFERELADRAMELIQPEFHPATWQAFVEHGVKNRPAAEVASELQTTVGAIYAARCRVVARLRVFLHGMLE